MYIIEVHKKKKKKTISMLFETRNICFVNLANLVLLLMFIKRKTTYITI